MPATEYGFIKMSGGALVGAVVAVLGIKKIIKTEIVDGIKPTIDSVKEDLAEMKAKKHITQDQHKLICGMNATNVKQQFDHLKEHMDIKFEALEQRLSGRK